MSMTRTERTASYTLAIGYDNKQHITSKSQHLIQGDLPFESTLNVGYELMYTYRKKGKKEYTVMQLFLYKDK